MHTQLFKAVFLFKRTLKELFQAEKYLQRTFLQVAFEKAFIWDRDFIWQKEELSLLEKT